MQIVGLTVLLLLSLVLESTLLEQFNIFGVTADLVMVWVVLLTLLWGRRRGVAVGLIFGLVEDVFFARYIGANALAKIAVAFFVGSFEGKIYKENIIVPVLATAASSMVYQMCIWLLELYLGRMVDFNLRILLGFVMYNSLVALVFYPCFYKSSNSGWLKLPENWRGIGG